MTESQAFLAASRVFFLAALNSSVSTSFLIDSGVGAPALGSRTIGSSAALPIFQLLDRLGGRRAGLGVEDDRKLGRLTDLGVPLRGDRSDLLDLVVRQFEPIDRIGTFGGQRGNTRA